jgi:hypothetical protein
MPGAFRQCSYVDNKGAAITLWATRINIRSRHSQAGKATGVHIGRPRTCGSVPGWGDFSFYKASVPSLVQPSHRFDWLRVLSPPGIQAPLVLIMEWVELFPCPLLIICIHDRGKFTENLWTTSSNRSRRKPLILAKTDLSLFWLYNQTCNIVFCSRNNQHALICTTTLFHILAPTCFGSSLPSSGSFLDPSELL